MDAFDPILKLLTSGGSAAVIGGLLVLLFCLNSGILVFGWVYRQERARANFWEALALHQAPALREAVDLAERIRA